MLGVPCMEEESPPQEECGTLHCSLEAPSPGSDTLELPELEQGFGGSYGNPCTSMLVSVVSGSAKEKPSSLSLLGGSFHVGDN